MEIEIVALNCPVNSCQHLSQLTWNINAEFLTLNVVVEHSKVLKFAPRATVNIDVGSQVKWLLPTTTTTDINNQQL